MPTFHKGPYYHALQVNVQYITKVVADLSTEDLVALKVRYLHCTWIKFIASLIPSPTPSFLSLAAIVR